MWIVSEIVCAVTLLLLSVKDIQMRKVPVSVLVIAGAGSIIYQIISGRTDWQLVLGGVTVGAMFLLISKATGEGVGYGDSIGILVLGIFLGFWRIITVLSIAFFLLLLISIFVLWRKNMSRRLALPFYPFLTGGYFCLLLMEGIK